MSASVTIFHNVVWSRHKGEVLSALHNISGTGSIRYSMVQIADTEHDRIGFSDVDYSFHRYPMKKLYNGCYEDVPTWRMTARLVWEVLKAKSDLVVLPGYHRPEYWAMMAACIVTGKRRAVFCDSTARDNPRRMLTSIPKRVFFALCDGYFAFGTRSREYLMSLGAKQEKIFIPCQAAALPRSFSPDTVIPDRLAHRQGNKPVFLFVGRLSAEKGIDTLVDAFKLLRKSVPNAELRIVGTGPLGDELKKQVADAGLQGAVHFLGSLQDAPLSREYFSATCMVLPSKREPWGLVTNEALNHGCPVIVSESCGCVPELVVEGVSGYAFPAGDVASLHRTMLKSLEAFADTAGVARRCSDVIQRFDPPSAAANIARGCALLLTN
ncbi:MULTISPECIES: glycosyltransferase family 4 protein [unclassified Caballeronia]|uniref:glycosyltransferase family 4 protein n=1 Tax=unclassified Caballeronia TaxID=2646786 RepID=UPI002855EB39|nr:MULTISPECIES: glycosyltransferase family 4 protein [unclassified Caballeronia]MDR5737714.1 glycosyltransferase family 4 protein [Caballeronia sp. LZ016]MDR5809750.1 glycosyltransferase family 4 protein [Caballeronia sp. LZ019]